MADELVPPRQHVSQRRLAFFGTGIMGTPMARRLALAGFDVAAWNRSRAKSQPLAAHGVRVCDHPSEAIEGADTLIVMLSTGEVIDEALFGADARGFVPAEMLRAGSTVVVMSTIEVATARAQSARLGASGVAYVDAPVSGGEVGAQNGTLAILAGGAEQVIDTLREIFAPLGRVTRIGEAGTGQLAKLANQIIVGGTLAAVAEALHFARCGGADLKALRAALSGGFGDSKILHIHGERMVERNFVPGSPAEQQLGALRSASALAAELGVELTLLDAVTRMFGDMIAHEGGNIDVSGILAEVERRAKPGGG
jgi:3-hydroxyisobutyrate dehydrogenase-like beta-hydroxyacid dehydrogenase